MSLTLTELERFSDKILCGGQKFGELVWRICDAAHVKPWWGSWAEVCGLPRRMMVSQTWFYEVPGQPAAPSFDRRSLRIIGWNNSTVLLAKALDTFSKVAPLHVRRYLAQMLPSNPWATKLYGVAKDLLRPVAPLGWDHVFFDVDKVRHWPSAKMVLDMFGLNDIYVMGQLCVQCVWSWEIVYRMDRGLPIPYVE